jgi:hypothetical protein
LFFDLSGELIEAIGSSSLIIIYIIAILDTRSTLATAHAVRLAAKEGRKEEFNGVTAAAQQPDDTLCKVAIA